MPIVPVLPNEQNQMPPVVPPPQPAPAPAPPPGAQAGPAAPATQTPAMGKGVTNWAKKAKAGATFKDAKGNTWTMGANGPEMTSSGGKGGGKGGKRPIAEQASMQWANDVLGGNFESNPWIRNLMDPEALDVRNNPNLQAVADSIQGELQEDWLGNLRQLDSAAESRGRGGSPLAAALRARETEETQEAAANALNQLYAGAYENERNRQMQGLGMSLQAQAQAAGIPISWFEAQTGRQGVNVQRQLGREANQIDRGRLGLARQQFNFEREMGLANAQQDALNDYMGLLATIGGMGGTTTTPGQYVPTQSPWAAGLLGGMGGWMQGDKYFSNRGNK